MREDPELDKTEKNYNWAGTKECYRNERENIIDWDKISEINLLKVWKMRSCEKHGQGISMSNDL